MTTYTCKTCGKVHTTPPRGGFCQRFKCAGRDFDIVVVETVVEAVVEPVHRVDFYYPMPDLGYEKGIDSVGQKCHREWNTGHTSGHDAGMHDGLRDGKAKGHHNGVGVMHPGKWVVTHS